MVVSFRIVNEVSVSTSLCFYEVIWQVENTNWSTIGRYFEVQKAVFIPRYSKWFFAGRWDSTVHSEHWIRKRFFSGQWNSPAHSEHWTRKLCNRDAYRYSHIWLFMVNTCMDFPKSASFHGRCGECAVYKKSPQCCISLKTICNWSWRC